MSSIGKIFVVLNLVLAAAFVGWAANAVSLSGDYKTKLEAAQAAAGKEKMQLEAELSKVRADNQLVTRERASAIDQRDEAKRAQDRLQTEKNELEKTNSNLQAAVTNIETTLGEISAQREKAFDDTKKSLAAMKASDEAKRTAEIAQTAAEAAQAEAESQLRAMTDQVASLEKEKTTLLTERQNLQTQMDTLVANTGVKISDFQPVPDIDGNVLGIDTSVAPGLVGINKGSTQGVRRGFVFEIFDGGTYKGQVRVEFVHGDMSSGLITRTVTGQTIRQGDGATTRL